MVTLYQILNTFLTIVFKIYMSRIRVLYTLSLKVLNLFLFLTMLKLKPLQTFWKMLNLYRPLLMFLECYPILMYVFLLSLYLVV